MTETTLRPLVILESPFAGDIERNLIYARKALCDSIHRGESPIASHLLYTQPGVLLDSSPEERKLGISCGLSWLRAADRHVFYTDLGWSPGMLSALQHTLEHYYQIEILFRSLNSTVQLPPQEHLNFPHYSDLCNDATQEPSR